MSGDPTPAHLLLRRYSSEARARAARQRRLERLAPALLETARRAEAAGRGLRERDPIAFAHRYQAPLDRELVALVAATLAFGNAVAIAGTLERVVAILGPRPREVEAGRLSRLEGLRHRWVSGKALRALHRGVLRVQEEAGSLGAALGRARRDGRDLREALATWRAGLLLAARPRGEEEDRGLRYLLSDPRGAGASKRLHLFLRWMVRGPDGVDLGLWRGEGAPRPSELIVPLDTHVHWLARAIGLLERRDAGWKSAEEITWMLRGIDPEDPLRFDFPLAHLGISGGCRHRHVASICRECPLATVCRPALRAASR
ncbi:MAG: TIGR02757 family protein [Deltaproteobacteria bacterium]|nr:TIGR02757 family protein [Deltaproteobacteria bacterium]